ncbi:uncharacterized protein At2g24330 [Lathyrus oleraceus]|uniref:Lunapark zinc ribbon domain-containing protein n=1 Tax=Pisum sativum TaxID=3888 RepID=A0A9D5AD41_PEA|nr:uncharacterized protein At2g24330-like [Pisum sativum]KAI5403568.1 hypothetical protein KIW84_050941 [Pisum sativum]
MADDKAVVEVEKKETTPTAAAAGNEKKKGKGFFSRILNGFFRVFRSHGDDFEKRLQHISKEEASIIAKVARRSRSRRRVSRNLILFSVILEVIAVGYAIMTTRSMGIDWKMRAIRVLPMFLLPALSTAAYSAFISFTRMCDQRDQNILEKLRAERQAKIDELKEKTNYYSTQQLIQRYDPDPAAKAAAATVLASKLGADSGLQWYMGDDSNLSGASTGKSNDVELVQSSGLRNRRQAQTRSTAGTGTTSPNFADQQLVGSGGFDQTQGSEYNQPTVVEHQPQSSNPQDAGWIARIAAMLVGEDPTQSYALICGNCHMHNGLARKEDFPFITYYCPHCHALNKPKQLDGVSGLPSPNSRSVQRDGRILALPPLNAAGSVQLDEHISGLPSPSAGSVQLDELTSGLPSPKAGSPKTGDSEAVLNASASAAESTITSNSPVNDSPEIEEVSERTSLEEKTD